MSVHIAFETPKDVQDSVYELVKLVANDNGRLKKGSNEVTKAAERGTAQMVVMAENVNPAELLAHIPLICKEKSIPFIYVEDQSYLAEAAGMNSGAKTAAIALMEVGKGAKEAFDGIKGQTDALN
ncbi:MAG: ribosomal L7Ae/L30e/S12e/Gadd45 family protein [Candidatus Thermoplasmatota archaeon]|nr:ribosomal L7Ae/L30e/S12e/Gadd45 family protein [Candidatus Thermoplasmatota archaeon]MEE3083386.1 ribosomal L7Ae/L30e/S12e/Gadd45 family protein [Candidatus Thermoplasmatota archaeon]